MKKGKEGRKGERRDIWESVMRKEGERRMGGEERGGNSDRTGG